MSDKGKDKGKGNGKEEQSKITMCSASWCGFSKKFEAQIKEENKEKFFDIVHCDKHKEHKACDGVNGFPTFKMPVTTKGKSGENTELFKECSVGFGPTGDIIEKCKLK